VPVPWWGQAALRTFLPAGRIRPVEPWPNLGGQTRKIQGKEKE